MFQRVSRKEKKLFLGFARPRTPRRRPRTWPRRRRRARGRSRTPASRPRAPRAGAYKSPPTCPRLHLRARRTARRTGGYRCRIPCPSSVERKKRGGVSGCEGTHLVKELEPDCIPIVQAFLNGVAPPACAQTLLTPQVLGAPGDAVGVEESDPRVALGHDFDAPLDGPLLAGDREPMVRVPT